MSSFGIVFILNSILLGVGLAMDAFSVSMANGLNEPNMCKVRTCKIAGVFAGFQFAMPLIGWICVHTIAEYFESFQKFIPWIALFLLLFIGGKMLIEGIQNKDSEEEKPATSFKELIIQGIATSIDALSVGFTIAKYNLIMAIISSVIIGIVTFVICVFGLKIGNRFGEKLANKANILGGIILIGIGIEICVSNVFF